MLYTCAYGWLGEEVMRALLLGAWNRFRMTGPVHSDPITSRALPVPYKHQLTLITDGIVVVW